jgi:dihydroneopterin aldolase
MLYPTDFNSKSQSSNNKFQTSNPQIPNNMFTVSVHGIKIQATIGLYPEEKIKPNSFEIDIDLTLPDTRPLPFADYSLIQKIVADIFQPPGELLEPFVLKIHDALKEAFPIAGKIKVTIRKLRPPMPGDVDYAQVCYETP